MSWQLIKITATSSHPVRNSRNELISGEHTLWDQSDPSKYKDDGGSLQPNVYGYAFNSPVGGIGYVNVTVMPLKRPADVPTVFLVGTINGTEVFKSAQFKFTAKEVVRVPVITPKTSAKPFSWNADVVWTMVSIKSGQLPCSGPGTTRLELYWIASTVHIAFQPSIPIDFLRKVLGTKPVETSSTFYQDMTNKVFKNFNKSYDTFHGASHYGVSFSGGNFWVANYLLTGQTLYANCFDQAAMLELCCSLQGGKSGTSWLYQWPFGFINTTNLVGVVNQSNNLIPVNNPFFRDDTSHANVAEDFPTRTAFGCHVYNGHSKPWQSTTDVIYDACGGPYLGAGNINHYLTKTIDTKTNLYRIRGQTPGGTNNILVYDGITGINGSSTGLQVRPTMEPLPPHLNAVVASPGTVTHVDWARLPTWLQVTLGDTWSVDHGWVTVSEAEVQALWYLSDATRNTIRVHVVVASALTPNGGLNVEESAAIVRDRIRSILRSTQRDDVWVTRTLPGLEEASLQYADDSGAGRVIVVAGNVVMDIEGMTSGSALMPHALKLLNHTARRNRPPLVVPVMQRRAIKIGVDGATTGAETDVITVTGIDTRFSVVFWVDCEIAAVGAASDHGTGVLFDRHTVDELGSGRGRTVELFFIAREVGRHRVHMYVADLETMVQVKSALEVEVVVA